MAASDSSQTGLLQVGQIIRPMLRQEDIPPLVHRLYGLTVVSIKELNSYDDKNYWIKVEPRSSNPHLEEVSTSGYVLKVTNTMDSKNHQLIDAQNQMMLYLHGKGVCVPKPEKNVHGTYQHLEKMTVYSDDFVENNTCERPSGEYMVRMLIFLPGKILDQVSCTPELLVEVGQFVARVDNELQLGFSNTTLQQRSFIWMLQNVPEVRQFSFAVRDEGRRKIVTEVLDTWDKHVVPVVPKLSKGIIFGDFNEQNIIVEEDAEGKAHVKALIDFGDVHSACYVFEIAITIMYLMLVVEAEVMHPNEAGGHVLAGYLRERKLTEDDWSVLRECVAARFAQSLVMGAYSYEQDPGNEYLLVTARKGWQVLQDFWSAPKDLVITRWKQIIDAYKA